MRYRVESMHYASLEHGGQHLEGYEEAFTKSSNAREKNDMSCYELPSYFVEQRRHKLKKNRKVIL